MVVILVRGWAPSSDQTYSRWAAPDHTQHPAMSLPNTEGGVGRSAALKKSVNFDVVDFRAGFLPKKRFIWFSPLLLVRFRFALLPTRPELSCRASWQQVSALPEYY